MFKIITKKRYNELVERNASLHDELLAASRDIKAKEEEISRRAGRIGELESLNAKCEETISLISKENISKNQRVRLSKLLFSVFALKAKNANQHN
jgi:hypothetical protein